MDINVLGMTDTVQQLINIQRQLASLFDKIGSIAISTPPGGVNGNVQYNNAGAFGGLTDIQLTAKIQAFTSTLNGAAPLSGGGTTNFLRADGGWAVPLATPVSVANGGTGLSSGTSGGILGYTAAGTLASSIALTQHALVIGGGAGATPTPLASLGTTTTVLHGNAAGDPTFAAVSLTADVTGTLAATNGGTGATSLNASLSVSAGAIRVTPLAQTQSTPANPIGTADLTGKMMGLAGTITPLVTGKVLIVMSGTIFNPTAIGDGAMVQIYIGTGTAPSNGDAITGTAFGGLVRYIASTAAGKVPFSLNAYVSGLVAATAYWIDVVLVAANGGTATISDVSISAVELE